MARYFLIACAEEKAVEPRPAALLYQSRAFKAALWYAWSQKPDGIFILSAKHGLLAAHEVVAPYDEKLPDDDALLQKWTALVLEKLSAVTNTACDHFVILASGGYRKFLVDKLAHVEVPFAKVNTGWPAVIRMEAADSPEQAEIDFS